MAEMMRRMSWRFRLCFLTMASATLLRAEEAYDVTRVITFVMANEGSNKPYPFIGVSEGHHDLSHHGNDEEKKGKIQRINTFHLPQFASLVNTLNQLPAGDGTLEPGRHIRDPNETPLTNLWLPLLNRLEIDVQKLGDSTGELPLLNG